ncbi:MoaD/ThiS family protein [Planctomicrobium piriforme]|uniref:ThiS family protein n=1 Tax=Planctomicrobium piriforme TaxID=1576369 RepID=A0A1I3G9F0_9PLAN|nr:MoaD/ThiS family protein [Planctomicrobium piriforme]SFI20027.1 ThiS family protein [Planctomicrobium piriforme]
MARVHFTSHLSKHVECPICDVGQGMLRDVLDEVFVAHPRLAGYVLDDQRRLRQHVMVFVDNAMVRDRDALQHPVGAESEVYVMQALSGG